MIALRNFIKFHLLKRGLVEIREDVDGLGRQLRRMEASLRQSSINSANGLRTSASHLSEALHQSLHQLV